MTWAFHYTCVADGCGFAEPCGDWRSAVDFMRAFIAQVHPRLSVNSLNTECENIPIGVAASITDGEHIFAVKFENACTYLGHQSVRTGSSLTGKLDHRLS